MLILLSPAKKLDFADAAQAKVPLTAPVLFKETKVLMETVAKLKAADLKRLMKLSDPLAKLNHERFQAFDVGSSKPKGARQACFAFDGDTYVGLKARMMSAEDVAFAQEHVRILSGLYGLLRPLDALSPYRLEMGTKLVTPRGTSLYDFWGDLVARALEKDLSASGGKAIINCASTEYFTVLKVPALKSRVITPVFKEMRRGQAKIVSFSAKRARGSLARFAVEKRITTPEKLQAFNWDDYRYVKEESTDNEWLFLRG